MLELKPCPFCGEKIANDTGKAVRKNFNLERVYVLCESCGARGPEFFLAEDWVDKLKREAFLHAMAWWNKGAGDA